MSRLFHTESGRVTPTLNEELSRHRRARKLLALPATTAEAELYVLARAHAGVASPLLLEVNDGPPLALEPASAGPFRWHTVTVPAGALRDGANVCTLRTDTDAGTWALAMELGASNGASALSTDGGRTWREEDMGYLNVGAGDYVVRIRLGEGRDPAPPAIVPEDPGDERLAALRRRLPQDARDAADPLAAVRRLATWTAGLLRYRNGFRVAAYTPWDPVTIVAWAGADRGHDDRPPMAMCAHYTALFVMSCAALGIPARCAVMTEDLNGWNGHFAAEVRLDDRWVYVDPTYDLVVDTGSGPLTFDEVRRLGSAVGDAVRRGAGFQAQAANADAMAWFEGAFLSGRCFRHRGVWPRTDFLSRPELTPPGHGAVPYCETPIVWERSARGAGFGMFPYFAPADYFAASVEPTR